MQTHEIYRPTKNKLRMPHAIERQLSFGRRKASSSQLSHRQLDLCDISRAVTAKEDARVSPPLPDAPPPTSAEASARTTEATRVSSRHAHLRWNFTRSSRQETQPSATSLAMRIVEHEPDMTKYNERMARARRFRRVENSGGGQDADNDEITDDADVEPELDTIEEEEGARQYNRSIIRMPLKSLRSLLRIRRRRNDRGDTSDVLSDAENEDLDDEDDVDDEEIFGNALAELRAAEAIAATEMREAAVDPPTPVDAEDTPVATAPPLTARRRSSSSYRSRRDIRAR